jgi:aminopeptidase N
MPIEFEVHYKDGTTDKKRQWIASFHEEVIIPNTSGKEIDFVLFDPNRKVIKKVQFSRPYNELASQALKSPNMIDRYDALLALRDFALEQKKKDLFNCYNRETYQLTKGEIISQLAADNSRETNELLVRAINDQDDKVRLAVLQSVTSVPSSVKADYEKLLSDSSYLNVELALTNLCSSFPDETKRYLEITKNETGWRGRNIRIKWLELSINSGNLKVIDELKSYTGESYDFETRINSINALKRLNILDELVVKNMILGLVHWNYKIRAAEAENLKYFYSQDKYKALIDKVYAQETNTAAKAELDKIRKIPR